MRVAAMLLHALVGLVAIGLVAGAATWAWPATARGIRFVAVIGVGMVLASTALRIARRGAAR